MVLGGMGQVQLIQPLESPAVLSHLRTGSLQLPGGRLHLPGGVVLHITGLDDHPLCPG